MVFSNLNYPKTDTLKIKINISRGPFLDLHSKPGYPKMSVLPSKTYSSWGKKKEKKKMKNFRVSSLYPSIQIHKINQLPRFMIHLASLVRCNDPSLINFKLRLLNLSREYCLDAFLQSVPAFIIAANSS